jgi:hypothetical protein
VVLLRRQFNRPLALLDRTDPGQPQLGFAEVLGGKREVWEYAALVTSLDSEILTLGQLYRDRADCENAFDELKNHWGWGGFTTQDLKRCRLLAASVAQPDSHLAAGDSGVMLPWVMGAGDRVPVREHGDADAALGDQRDDGSQPVQGGARRCSRNARNTAEIHGFCVAVQEDSMGRAVRTWQLRRCNLTDGVPRCPSRTT